MEGTDRVRFCQSCAKNVYNLSAMSQSEAEQLITDKEGELCIRYFRRADGTIITDNCPVGLKFVRRPFKFLLAGFAAFTASGIALFFQQPRSVASAAHSSSQTITLEKCRKLPVIGAVINYFRPYTFMGAAANQVTS
jgi:hypothetical protein